MQTIAYDALSTNLLLLMSIRLVGMFVFIDLLLQKWRRYYILLILGLFTTAAGSAWGLYTYTVLGEMENYYFSLLAGMGTFWVGCGALRYFNIIRIRFITVGSFVILGYALLPFAGFQTGISPGLLVQLFTTLLITFAALFKRHLIWEYARSSTVWLVILAIAGDAHILAYLLGWIKPDNLALGFAGTSLIQVVFIIFFLHLEHSLSLRQAQSSESRFRGMIKNLLEGFFAATMDFTLLAYNSEFCNILGLSQDTDHTGINLPEFLQNPGDETNFLTAIQNKELVRGFQVNVKKADGSPIVLLVNSRLVKATEDIPEHIEGTFLDITAQKEAEAAIRQFNARLEKRVAKQTRELRLAQEKLLEQEKLAVLGQLAGGVGHELRNPLGVISNAAYYLKLVLAETDKKVQDYLDMIEVETRNADRTINNLLDFSHLPAANLKPEPVKELAARVLERFPAPEGVQVNIDLPDDLPAILADPRQAERALENLVVNAWNALERGGEFEIKARRALIHDQDYICITVSNNGRPMAAEELGNLFKPLFTTRPRGVGLGLAVCKKLVEANQGWIEAQTEPGKGSAFTVTLLAAK